MSFLLFYYKGSLPSRKENCFTFTVTCEYCLNSLFAFLGLPNYLYSNFISQHFLYEGLLATGYSLLHTVQKETPKCKLQWFILANHTSCITFTWSSVVRTGPSKGASLLRHHLTSQNDDDATENEHLQLY